MRLFQAVAWVFNHTPDVDRFWPAALLQPAQIRPWRDEGFYRSGSFRSQESFKRPEPTV
jgi:hypothetical protein